MTMVETTDRGTIQLPTRCPHWCSREAHVSYALENDGTLDAAEATAHGAQGGEAVLPEIRNSVSHRIERDGGGTWELRVRQELREPFTERSGYASAPMVQLHVSDRGLVGMSAVINLTTGELRVLAAHAVALADRVDLGRAAL